MTNRHDVIVIGAGHNGLTAAALLAAAGRHPLVLERRDRVGGLAAAEEFHPGYRTNGVLWDTTGVRDWVIERLGLEQQGLGRLPHHPPVLVPRRDGPGLMLYRDPDRAADELRDVAPDDVPAYREYRAVLDRIAPVVRHVLDRPPPDIFDPGRGDLIRLTQTALKLRLLGDADMMELTRAAPMPLADWLGDRFGSELLGAALAAPHLHHTVLGPRAPNSTANLLLTESIARPPIEGGPGALIRALADAARTRGAEIRTGATVRRLRTDGRKVDGVVLDDGEALPADQVVATCDPKQLFLELLPREARPKNLEHSASAYRARGAAAIVHLALSGYPAFTSRPDETPSAIRIGETFDELERASDAAKYGKVSERPILEIRVPTIDDPDLAPEGHHVFSILVHFAPFQLEGEWDDARTDALLRTTVDRLAEYAPSVRELMVGHDVLSPWHLQERYAVTNGHLYHGEHAPDQLLVRPFLDCHRYATPFPGLFLAGSGSHPGGGLTGAPGALAAETILAAT